MENLVSILIPVYNAEQYLADTLKCALEQTWPRKEIIVVDDGSTDDSLEIAKKYEGPNVTVVSQENQGACVARNRALAEANGDFIQYLDSDDLMERDKIEVQVKRLLTESSGTLAVGPWERFYNAEGTLSLSDIEVTFCDKPYYRDYPDGIEWAITAVGRNGMFPPHAWLVPRPVVEKAGFWDESLLINQDGEYFNRVVLASNGIAFCENARVYYRSGMEHSISQRRSPTSLKSKYQSISQITDQILSEESSTRARRACARAFQAFAYNAYPEVSHYVSRAVRNAGELSDSVNYRPNGSKLYQYIHDLVGWRMAKLLRRWYYILRHKIEI
jgi:glycosyltransferase involved in cell wall biosynthesis